MTVHVLPKFGGNPYPCVTIDTTVNTGRFCGLSPFVLGPIETYVEGVVSKNFENLWQFSKVYKWHLDEASNPTEEWFKWRDGGWATQRAIRYPAGKGAIPAYSYWNGQKLGYIEARKRIYAPIYAKNVRLTDSYLRLQTAYQRVGNVTLLDYDAYDHIKQGATLVDVINNPERKMGHAFVLAMLLQNMLAECITS